MSAKKPARVFIVEDDPDVRDSLQAFVTALGHQCNTFDAAELLLKHGDLSDCDYLLVDFNLPGMNGTDLLAKIRSAGHRSPAALYTGQIDSRVRQAAATLDNTPVIEKGDDITAIVTHLGTFLGQSSR